MIGLAASPELVPNPDSFAENLPKPFEELETSALFVASNDDGDPLRDETTAVSR